MPDENNLNFTIMVEDHHKEEVLKSVQKGIERASLFSSLGTRNNKIEIRLKELIGLSNDRFDFISEFAKAGLHDVGVCKLRISDEKPLAIAHMDVLASEFESILEDIDELSAYMIEMNDIEMELLSNKVKQQIVSTPAVRSLNRN